MQLTRFASLLPSRTLKQIHMATKSKVSDKWESYLHVYDGLFRELRQKPIRLLEIGIQNGGSLETWSKYFARGQVFIGCDIDPKCANLKYRDKRIQVLVADGTTAETARRIRTMCPVFDIIIDDGSHRSDHILLSFLNMFDALAPGGIYCIEDTHTLYWPEFGGGLGNPVAAQEFFKALSDVVNFEHWRNKHTVADFLRQTFPDQPVPAFVSEGWVESVEFRNSMIIVRKAEKSGHNKLGERLIRGRDAIVNSEPLGRPAGHNK